MWLRLLVAAITAPLLGVGAVTAAFLIVGLRGLETGGGNAGQSVWVAMQMMGGVAFILAPAAYAVELLVMLTGWLLLRKRLAGGTRPGLAPVAGITIAAGIVTVAVTWAVFDGITSVLELLQAAGAGALAGGVAGGWFWLVAWGLRPAPAGSSGDPPDRPVP